MVMSLTHSKRQRKILASGHIQVQLEQICLTSAITLGWNLELQSLIVLCIFSSIIFSIPSILASSNFLHTPVHTLYHLILTFPASSSIFQGIASTAKTMLCATPFFSVYGYKTESTHHHRLSIPITVFPRDLEVYRLPNNHWSLDRR